MKVVWYTYIGFVVMSTILCLTMFAMFYDIDFHIFASTIPVQFVDKEFNDICSNTIFSTILSSEIDSSSSASFVTNIHLNTVYVYEPDDIIDQSLISKIVNERILSTIIKLNSLSAFPTFSHSSSEIVLFRDSWSKYSILTPFKLSNDSDVFSVLLQENDIENEVSTFFQRNLDSSLFQRTLHRDISMTTSARRLLDKSVRIDVIIYIPTIPTFISTISELRAYSKLSNVIDRYHSVVAKHKYSHLDINTYGLFFIINTHMEQGNILEGEIMNNDTKDTNMETMIEYIYKRIGRKVMRHVYGSRLMGVESQEKMGISVWNTWEEEVVRVRVQTLYLYSLWEYIQSQWSILQGMVHREKCRLTSHNYSCIYEHSMFRSVYTHMGNIIPGLELMCGKGSIDSAALVYTVYPVMVQLLIDIQTILYTPTNIPYTITTSITNNNTAPSTYATPTTTTTTTTNNTTVFYNYIPLFDALDIKLIIYSAFWIPVIYPLVLKGVKLLYYTG